MRSILFAGLAAAAALMAQAAPASAQVCAGNMPCPHFGGGGGGARPAHPNFIIPPPGGGGHGGYANNGWHGNGGWNNGGGGWHNNGWHNNGWNNNGWNNGAAALGGFAAGALVGGALAAPYAYGGGPYYNEAPAPYYEDEGGAAASADPVAYCSQRYRSYDPASGTYLGYDGLRHPCP